MLSLVWSNIAISITVYWNDNEICDVHGESTKMVTIIYHSIKSNAIYEWHSCNTRQDSLLWAQGDDTLLDDQLKSLEQITIFMKYKLCTHKDSKYDFIITKDNLYSSCTLSVWIHGAL